MVNALDGTLDDSFWIIACQEKEPTAITCSQTSDGHAEWCEPTPRRVFIPEHCQLKTLAFTLSGQPVVYHEGYQISVPSINIEPWKPSKDTLKFTPIEIHEHPLRTMVEEQVEEAKQQVNRKWRMALLTGVIAALTGIMIMVACIC